MEGCSGAKSGAVVRDLGRYLEKYVCIFEEL